MVKKKFTQVLFIKSSFYEYIPNVFLKLAKIYWSDAAIYWL